MPNYSNATIIGHLGKNPEVRKTQSGTTVYSATLAVSTGYGDNKRTTWWNVSAFGKQAETLEKFGLAKGDVVGFSGEAFMREYQSNGNTRHSLELAVRDFILLGSKKEGATEQNPKPAPQSDAPFDDEIPF